MLTPEVRGGGARSQIAFRALLHHLPLLFAVGTSSRLSIPTDDQLGTYDLVGQYD